MFCCSNKPACLNITERGIWPCCECVSITATVEADDARCCILMAIVLVWVMPVANKLHTHVQCAIQLSSDPVPILKHLSVVMDSYYRNAKSEGW